MLSDFARTLITDFPIQGILDHLVERIVDVLPISSAGVTIISPGAAPRYIAASNGSALQLESLQADIGHGPGRSAYQLGSAVKIPDLRLDRQCPQFAAAALAAGLASVFAFPLRHSDGRLGALDLYREVSGPLDENDLAAAQTLADVAAVYVLNAQAREEARLASDLFRQGALHDPLTGLPNRVLLQQRLDHAALRARRSRAHAAVLFVDLDHFKRINDAHGHHVGDEVLLAVARRLSSVVRPGDTLARVSGDEFVILCEDLDSATDVEVLVERIGGAFRAPFVLSVGEMTIPASVGMAFAGPGEAVSEQLMIDADIAMYATKRKGGAGHQVIDLRKSRRSDRNSLERALRTALAHDELDLAYQPIVRVQDGQVIGMEAGLRWTDPDAGPIPMSAMVGIAERSGLIDEVGAWALQRSCGDRGRWLESAPGSPVQVAVNVSVRQLMAPDFCATVADILARTSTDPATLILEMTENVFVQGAERALTVLADLKAMGVRLALDDFGTGYSALSSLRQFPVDIIKIDPGFTADLGQDAAADAIVAAVINLAHVLGLGVTAKGIGTRRQRDAVLAMGCESAQGSFYGQPMPAHAVGALLANRRSGREVEVLATAGDERPGDV